MERKSLREISAVTGASRRAIQGYEKAGLVSASGKNKYGHLLYDREAEKRICQIRFYQQVGFSVREIGDIIDAPDSYKREVLEKKVLELTKECERIRELIQRVKILLDSLG